MEKLKRKTREGRSLVFPFESRYADDEAILDRSDYQVEWKMEGKRNRERERMVRKEDTEEEIGDATRDRKGRKGAGAKGRGIMVEEILVGSRRGRRGGKETEGAKGVKKTGETQRGERSGKGDERCRGEKEGLDARERYRVKAADPSALVQEAAAAREETSRPASVSGMLGAAIVILPPFHRAPIT